MSGPWTITGTGLVSPAGDQPATLFERLLEGRPLPLAEGRGYAARPLSDFDPRRYLDRKGLQSLSRTSQLACAAASRLAGGLAGVAGPRVGVVLGTAWASLDTVVRFEREALVEGPRFVDPILFAETVANVPAGRVSIFNGWSAVNATLVSGNASGLDALGRAVELLEDDRADAIVAGGADELNEHLLRTLEAERPDPAAGGPVGAEGACLFAIESARHAAERGARPIGCLRGWTGGFTDPGAADATAVRATWLRGLLRGAGWRAEEVDLVVLSSDGRPAPGGTEAAILAEVFGKPGPPCVAPKAILGECWGAAGPLGAAVALEALRRGIVPGRPAGVPAGAPGEAPWIPDRAQDRALRRALVLDCSETGQFAALALSAPE